MGQRGTSIVQISIWDSFRIHVLSCVVGAWVLFKGLARWVWDPNAFFSLQLRDNPPSCLVDSSLGQHKYVKLKGVKFHYVESGSRDQPVLLLLHGFPDCWLSWRYQIPILSAHFRVVALDLKGFGDSDKPIWRSSYKIDKILEEMRQLINALSVSSCIIIGHDLGALIGWYLVHQSPEIVDKFIAVSCPHPNIYWKTLPSASNFNSKWLNFIQLPYLPEMDALKGDIQIISDCHKHLEKDNEEIYLEAYKYSFSRKEDWSGPINYYRKLPFSRICEKSDQIKVSTLLITGNKDKFVKLEGIVKSTEYCEKFFVKIIDDSHHFPHQENPDLFNKVVLKYLRIREPSEKVLQKSPSKGLMDRMFGAVTTTVKYGNSMLDSVHKKTNGVVSSIPSIGLTTLTQNLGGAKFED